MKVDCFISFCGVSAFVFGVYVAAYFVSVAPLTLSIGWTTPIYRHIPLRAQAPVERLFRPIHYADMQLLRRSMWSDGARRPVIWDTHR
jgi:hypothetical protein